jgi:hypothetical protein
MEIILRRHCRARRRKSGSPGLPDELVDRIALVPLAAKLGQDTALARIKSRAYCMFEENSFAAAANAM